MLLKGWVKGAGIQILLAIFARVGSAPNPHVCVNPLGARMGQKRDPFPISGRFIECTERKSFPFVLGDDAVERVGFIGVSRGGGEGWYEPVGVRDFFGLPWRS